MIRSFIYALVLLCLVPAVHAGTGLVQMKDRGDMLGWEAVGRIDLDGKGFCTGVLISSELVLTAAHCVFDDAGRQLSPERVHFRAGYLNGKALYERRAARVVVAKGYNSDVEVRTTANVRRDVALIKLETPLFISEADPFVIHTDPIKGEKVQVMSYGRGRREAMSWQKDCNLLDRHQGVMAFDCDTTFGSSGAPVFVRYGTRVRILSLVSAGGSLGEVGDVTFGMDLPAIVAELRGQLRYDTAPVARVSNGAKRIRINNGTRNSGGAKFVTVKKP